MACSGLRRLYLGGPLATPGYANTTDILASPPPTNLTNPFPTGLLAPVGNSQGALVGVGTSLNNLVDPQTNRLACTSIPLMCRGSWAAASPWRLVMSVPIPTHLTLGQPNVNIDALNPSYLSHGSGRPECIGRESLLKLALHRQSPEALCPAQPSPPSACCCLTQPTLRSTRSSATARPRAAWFRQLRKL